MNNLNSILVLAPHTDDGELGAGGFINRLISSGAKVTYIAFSTAQQSLRSGLPKDTLSNEVMNAIDKLGINNIKLFDFPVRNFDSHRQEILEELIKIRSAEQFDLVLLPCSSDIHQDHQVIYNEGVRAFKHTCILGYELIWNNFQFKNHFYVKLNESDIANKIDALKQYKSQSHRNYMSEDFVRSLAYMRGLQINHKYAECFEVIRWVLN